MPISITEETLLILRTHSKGSTRSIASAHSNGCLYSQDESSEMFIGEWAEARGIRDQLFITTKVDILLNANDGPQTLTFTFFSTLPTSRLVMNPSLKKYFMLGIALNLCKSPLRSRLRNYALLISILFICIGGIGTPVLKK